MGRLLHVRRFLLAGAITTWALGPMTHAQTTTPYEKWEGEMAAVPLDFEFNSAGTRVVVRGVDPGASPDNLDVISIWSAESGLKLFGSGPGFCSAALAARPPANFSSDTVAVEGNTAVLIADHVNSLQVLVDVVDIGIPPGPASCLANFALPDPPPSDPWENCGNAHDVAITPDGKYAVVNCYNWIFFLDLSESPPRVVVQYNTAAPGIHPGWALDDQTEFWSAVDTVAVTNARGIVVQGAWNDGQTEFFPIVYLIDFLSVDPVPQITQIDMRQFLNTTEDDNFDPHDVAITPDGQLAVLTCQNAVSLFDLVTLGHVGSSASSLTKVWRAYPSQADSVELTNTHAVVIGGQTSTSIKVFSLWSGTVPALTETFSQDKPDGAMGGHDLALFDYLSPDQPEAAVIKAGNASDNNTGQNYVLRSFTSPVPTLITVASTGSPRVSGASGIPRMSDSVEAAFVLGTPRKRFGASIGAVRHTNPPAPISAHIDLFDVDATPPIVPVSFPVSHSTFDVIPTDLSYSLGTKRVFVRCQAPPEEAPPAATGRDVAVVRWTGLPQGWVHEVGGPLPPQIGGRGHMNDINQADTMIVNSRRAVSISEALSDIAGWVHTVVNQ